MLRRIGQSRRVQRQAGLSMAGWLRFVHATSRWQEQPRDLYAVLRQNLPVIIAMWHGQHFLIPFMQREGVRFAGLVSRHGDGEINAVALERLGVAQIRGSGGRANKQHKRGGPAALRAMINALDEGLSVCSTADVPRVGGIVGPGIVTLARLSGRPIFPVAAATSRMIRLDTWDRATVNLPFSRGAFVIGEPVTVARGDDIEAKQLEVHDRLNDAHDTAYAMVGRRFRGGEG